MLVINSDVDERPVDGLQPLLVVNDLVHERPLVGCRTVIPLSLLTMALTESLVKISLLVPCCTCCFCCPQYFTSVCALYVLLSLKDVKTHALMYHNIYSHTSSQQQGL